jgi:hypothetical protein
MVAMRMWARDVGEDSARRRDNAAGTHGGLSGRGGSRDSRDSRDSRGRPQSCIEGCPTILLVAGDF